jgi:GTP cyclohydrolase I
MSEPQFNEHDWRRSLASFGEDPDRAGIVETLSRLLRAWKHWTAGYIKDQADCPKVFEEGADEYSDLIVVLGIPVYSHCEHHLAPFFGGTTIGYVPNRKIDGLPKPTHLEPQAVGEVIRCGDLCLGSRGISTQREETITSSTLSGLQPNQALRAKSFALAREG